MELVLLLATMALVNIKATMKTLFLYLFPMLLTLGVWQDSTPTLLRDFMQDAADNKLSNTQIGDKYFCTEILHRTDRYGAQARDYLEFALSNQRPILRDKKYIINNFIFKRFDDLSLQEIPPKPFHIIGETKNIYVGKYEGKIVIYFLVESDKISSTLFFGQGDEHYFLDFCK